MLTRKDLEGIAEIISNSFGDDIMYYAPTLCVENLADHFEKEIPHFNREQFLKACGLGQQDA